VVAEVATKSILLNSQSTFCLPFPVPSKVVCVIKPAMETSKVTTELALK